MAPEDNRQPATFKDILVGDLRQKDRQSFENPLDSNLHTELLQFQDYHIVEQSNNKALDAGAVVATWGDEHGGDDLRLAINDHLAFMQTEYHREPSGKDMIGSTGVEWNFWSKNMERAQLLAFQVAVGIATGKAALAQIGTRAEHVASLHVVASAPTSLLLTEYIGQGLGLPRETKKHLTSGACDSWDMAVSEEIDDAQHDPQRTSLIIGIENLMAMRRRLSDAWRGTTNRTALAFFSDGAAAWVGKFGRFHKEIEIPYEHRDQKAALAAINTVPLIGKRISDLVVKNELATLVELPKPPGEDALFMDPWGTTKFFLDFIPKLVGKFATSEKFSPLSTITHANGHRPSFLLREKFRSLLVDLGLNEDLLRWSGEYGNSPCIIGGHEIVKTLPTLVPGSRLLTLFFGAGARGDIRIVNVE